MRVAFDLTKKRVLVGIILVFVVAFPTFVIGTNMGYNVGETKGRKEGYLQALNDVAEATGLTFEWVDLGNGEYEILVSYQGGLVAKGTAEFHLWVEHWRNGELLSVDHHAGTLTNVGKDWIEDQLGDSPSTTPAKYISCSAVDTSGWSNQSTWTELPTEINANGLARATGTYASTGTGAWNVTKTFSVTGTQTTQTYGLQWDSTPASDNNLLCSDTSSAKNCVDGDTLKVTWQVSVS